MDYPGAHSCSLDRHVTADPFYGELEYSATAAEGIAVLWDRVRETPSPVELTAKAVREDSGLIRVSAAAEFVRPWHDADLRWVCMIVADGVTGLGAGWNQSNDFIGIRRLLRNSFLHFLCRASRSWFPLWPSVILLLPPKGGCPPGQPISLLIRRLSRSDHWLTLPIIGNAMADLFYISQIFRNFASLKTVYGKISNYNRTAARPPEIKRSCNLRY